MYINANSTETICLIDILFLEFLEINQRNIYLFKTFLTSFFPCTKASFVVGYSGNDSHLVK